MKKVLKVLALSAAVVMMALSFAACGGNAGSKYKLITNGTLVMGTNAQFPPFEYQEGGQVVGVDASIMAAVAQKLGLKLTIKDMDFDSLPSALSGKTIDVIAAGYTVKPDREATMDFTDSYYTAQQTVIVKTGSAIKSKADLKGKKIGVQTGTTGDFDAQDITDKTKVVGYNNGSLAVQALISGSVDAVIIDNNPAKEYKNQHDADITLIENQFDPEQYAIAVSKGNTALQTAINNALKEMKSDGSLQKILDQFIK